jgi:glycosyltransferase involved in cell wall biosynthesis
VVIANSRAGAEFHHRLHGHHRDQYRVVHNGVNTERFVPQDGRPIRRELGIADDEHVVGIFASFKKEKNHALFFDASQHLLRRLPRTRLLLVGDELSGQAHGSDVYKQQIHDMVARTGIGSRCLFLGNRDDVASLYCACDVTVLPSLAEGTSNVLLESMACGVPVIATDVSDNRYIVPDGQVGRLVPLGDAATMAKAICSLLEDDELRIALGRQARQWVSREFSIAQLATKTRNVYLECLTRKCPTRLPDGVRLAQ